MKLELEIENAYELEMLTIMLVNRYLREHPRGVILDDLGEAQVFDGVSQYMHQGHVVEGKFTFNDVRRVIEKQVERQKEDVRGANL